MTADDIIRLYLESDTRDRGIREELLIRIAVEIAAQLADLNRAMRTIERIGREWTGVEEWMTEKPEFTGEFGKGPDFR